MQPSPEASVPTCIGIIMDGNRRWAKAKGLRVVLGHEQGLETLKKVLRWAKDRGVGHLIIYAFSTENWNRPKEEVDYLLGLIERAFSPGSKDLAEFKEEGGRLHFVGQRERFSPELQSCLTHAEEETKDGVCDLWICLSYGGRAEILHAVEELQKSGEPVSEESFAKHLWTAGMPDPDLIIRTSGEERLSGFLPWQGVYSELFFTKTYWPDFSEAELDTILAEFASRERRHGK